LSILRGTQPTYRWSGIYGGGQIGYSSSVVNFSQAASNDIGFILRNTAVEQDQQISKWSVLGSRSPVTTGVGAFLGYNIEWEKSDYRPGIELQSCFSFGIIGFGDDPQLHRQRESSNRPR
jgi:hypothetical protein